MIKIKIHVQEKDIVNYSSFFMKFNRSNIEPKILDTSILENRFCVDFFITFEFFNILQQIYKACLIYTL